jgi:hypothetical protein
MIAPLFYSPLIIVGVLDTEHDTANLKDLDILDTFLCSSKGINANPLIYDSFYVCHWESSECKIMPWMKNEDITRAMNRFQSEKRMGRYGCRRSWGRKDSRKIVFERKCVVVCWIYLATRPLVSRTQVTSGIVLREVSNLGRLGLTKPRPFGTMR